MNAQKTTAAYPGTASILAIIGGCFMILAGILILGLSIFIIPHFDASMFRITNGTMPVQDLPGFVGSFLTAVGSFGLISGLVVLGSGVLLRTNPSQSTVFGVLILIFSVLSFFGSGGFVVGAILGIIGGIMTLSWKRPAAVAQTPSSTSTV